MMNNKQHFTAQDHHFMARAIELAKNGHFTTSPNPRVGCVIVSFMEGIGKIIGEGYHQKAGQGHAEVNALNDAKKHNGALIKGSTAYVTLEPCSHFGLTPPCAKGLIDAQVACVISAMVDPNPKVSGNGIALLKQAGIKTQSGLLESAAVGLNTGFIQRMTTGLPYVRAKLAASLDGKTAMQSGESKWITSAEARQDVQRLRAQSCAIITGADSVISDNAKMTVRWSELGTLQHTYSEDQLRQPLRVIIDSQHRVKPELMLFEAESPILLVRLISESSLPHSNERPLENLTTWPHFVEEVEVNVNHKGKVDLSALLTLLAERGINDVLVESGAKLTGAFIEDDLVDELTLYQAPKLLGGDGKNLVEMPMITQLSQAKSLTISDIRMVGSDVRITALLKK
jgi:diaminohydroxyphosphoribosylaminopyrimidine deaminase/5-amino-6-(5-phosphoribosylamino)uracil reductase